MKSLDILIPFGLPPAEMAADIKRSLNVPGFATLLARAKSVTGAEMDPFSRALPHEKWLARQFGLAYEGRIDGLPLARRLMQSRKIAVEDGFWFILQPAHLHVARDHLVLTDLRKLDLNEAEARKLFQPVEETFRESGKTLLYGDARTWFLRADDWSELSTSTPDAASGHNIDIWMPRGPRERDWRRLLNEVQMTWHAHPVNLEREMRGHPPVNSLWLWGGATREPLQEGTRYERVFNPLPWLVPSETGSGTSANLSKVLEPNISSGLLILDMLADPAMTSDWSAWISAMHQLEREWMSPLLEALRNGRIGEIRLVLSHNTKLLEIASGKHSVKKFWIKPSLAALSR